MRRTLGATAIFLGWLCLPLSVLSGLVASQFMGLAHNDGPLPPTAVFGISGTVFIWLVVVGALLSSAPVFAAMFAADPSRPLYVTGVALAVVGAVLTLDDLGRAFGALLLPSGIFFGAGGVLMAGATDDTSAWDGDGAASPTPQWATGASRPAEQAAPAPLAHDASLAESSTAGAAALTQASAGTAPETNAESTCPWCSATIPANATTCPECHATIDSELLADNVPVAGLTEIPPELRAYAARGGKRKRKSLWRALRNDSEEVTFVLGPSSETAFRPPSPEVRAEMARIDREIAGTIEGPHPSPDAPDVASPAETASPAEVPPVHATETDGATELDQASAPDQASTADEAAAPAQTPETPAIPEAPARSRRNRRSKP